MDTQIVDSAWIRTAAHKASAIVDVTCLLVIAQRFEQRPVDRTALFHVLLAVSHGVRRAAGDTREVTSCQELSVGGARDENRATIAAV